MTQLKIEFSEVARTFAEGFQSIIEARECFETEAAEILNLIKLSDPRLSGWKFGYDNANSEPYGECESPKELVEKMRTRTPFPFYGGRIYLYKYLERVKSCFATLAIGAYPRRKGIYFYWGISPDGNKLPPSLDISELGRRVEWEECEMCVCDEPIPLASINGEAVAQQVDNLFRILSKTASKQVKR